MSATLPTFQSIIKSALRKLGVLGAGQTDPFAEDNEFALDTLNEIVGQWNTRKRFAWYMRNQEFTWTTARQSYTIGAAGNSPVPNFQVTAGNRPQRIEAAQLVLTDPSPDSLVELAIWDWEEYSRISSPALTGAFPQGIYYEAALPNGIIYPYPAFPSEVSNKLKLWWWVQLDTCATADLATPIYIPQGYERALALTLASALYLSFPKKTDLVELNRQTRIAVSDIQSVNIQSPYVDNPLGGIGNTLTGGNFLYQSRSRL